MPGTQLCQACGRGKAASSQWTCCVCEHLAIAQRVLFIRVCRVGTKMMPTGVITGTLPACKALHMHGFTPCPSRPCEAHTVTVTM